GMVLLLVLGIGGFLGPRLLGFAQLPQFVQVPEIPVPRGSKPLFYKIAGIALVLSLFGEYGLGFSALAFVRAAAASAVILYTAQPWLLPSLRSTLAWCVWTAHWLVVFAVWLVAIHPRYRVDFLHVLFIGGFTLLIVAVGTRVTLSHGGYSLTKEK